MNYSGLFNRAVTSINNLFSNPGNSVAVIYLYHKAIASGSLTANTLKTIMALSGSGYVDILAWSAADTTSRSVRMRVTIDGVVAFDSTSLVAAANIGVVPIGCQIPGTYTTIPQRVEFNTSFTVEISSNLSETNKVTVYTNYMLT